MTYIGIDLGTSSVKTLLMAAGGRVLGRAGRSYPVMYPRPGWSEQDPDLWIAAVKEALGELLAGQDRSQVAGISFGGQMHGLVLLDKNDRVIRPAILWNDNRTAPQTEALNSDPGKAALLRYTGNIAFAGFTAPKLMWLRENEPDTWARIAKIMLPKDYVAYRLTGQHVTDPSDASGTLFYDVKGRRWSPEMLERCAIDPTWLPACRESSQFVGTLLPSAANELGLSPSVKVAAGAGDNAAAAVGTGTVENGQCNISLGTSGTVFLAQDRFAADPAGAIHAFAHANGKYHLMGVALTGASGGKWWLEDVLGTSDYAGELPEAADLGRNRVFFLPYLMGERSPHNDPLARGCFIGMDAATTRLDMTLAVYEGLTFALRDSVERCRSLGAEIRRLSLCGGGAKSPLWRRLMADVMDAPLSIPDVEEGPSLGGAMLAAVCCGEYASVEEAAGAIVRFSRTVEPDREEAARYREKYEIFRSLYPDLKGVYARLARG